MAQQQWTLKSKSRRIVLQPSNRITPGHSSLKGTAPIISLFRAHEGASCVPVHPKSVVKGSEKINHYSKSQSAVKRQRSALWITKAHHLIMNQANQNQSINQSMQVAAKDLSTTTNQGLVSPQGQKSSLKTQQQINWQANLSLSAFDTGKYKKQSLQSARLTAEKYIKKQTADFSIFSKPSAVAPSSQFAIPTTASKAGEVFSSIARIGNIQTSQNLEMAQILKSTSTNPGKGTRKKKQIPSAKQIFSSMGLHNHIVPSQTNLSYLGSKRQPTFTQQTTGKATVLNGKRVHTISQNEKLITSKNGLKSQSRLEILEGIPSIVLGKKTAHNLPMRKFKKRKQQLVSNSLQSLQESFFNQNPQIEVQTAGNRQSRAKAVQSRSKSKSPSKKLVGYLARFKTRPVQRKQLALLVKKTIRHFETEEQDVDSSEKQLENGFKSLRNSNLQTNKGRKQISQFKTTTQSNNLNLLDVTADGQHSEGHLFKVLTKQSKPKSAQRLRSSNQELNDADEDSGSDSNELVQGGDYAVPDEAIGYEAAGDMFRQLSKLITFQMYNEQERNTPSQQSHRSHNNIGYSRSPLIECMSEAYADTEHEGILLSNQDVAQSKEEEMSSENQSGEDFDDVSGEGIPHGAELVEQVQQQQQDIMSSMSNTPSDDSLHLLNPNAQLTVPALKAQALVLLGSSQKATGSPCKPHSGLQTTQNKQQNETRQLANKNKDVTEWLLPPDSNYLYCQEQEGHGCQQEAAFKLGAHCPPTGVVDKPKSPSNLSEERDAESDSLEVLESDLMARIKQEKAKRL